MIKSGTISVIDEIRHFLLADHPEIQIKDTPEHYDIELFNLCEERNAFLLTLDGWKYVHPSLVTIPVDWNFKIPYGILYPLKPSSSLQEFLNALQGHCQVIEK